MGQLLDLEALADFLATVDAGSITAGARRRGQPKQSVSRRLMSLEADLGVRLFDRSKRALRLTPEGALLEDRARRALADLEDTKLTLSDRSAAVEGLVRISAPVLLGQTVLGTLAAHVVATHPKLRLEISLSDRRVDLVEEGFDAAIRVGPHEDPGLISLPLATADTIIVAAPSTIAAHGAPRSPEELSTRPCVLFGETSRSAEWTLWSGDRQTTVAVSGRLSCTSLKLCLDAAVAGAGFASIPAFIARPLIEAGPIVRVLPEWNSGREPLRIVYSSRRLLSARLRAFLDAAAAGLRTIDFGASPAPVQKAGKAR